MLRDGLKRRLASFILEFQRNTLDGAVKNALLGFIPRLKDGGFHRRFPIL
jgi:hypothetical protein